jgi:hypothetical protein
MRASLVSTFRLGLITIGLAESVLRFDFGTGASAALALRLGLPTTALPEDGLRLGCLAEMRTRVGFGLRAIVKSPRDILSHAGDRTVICPLAGF